VAGSRDGSEYSALRASLGWFVENGVTMVSSGYYGVNDGWQDLLGLLGGIAGDRARGRSAMTADRIAVLELLAEMRRAARSSAIGCRAACRRQSDGLAIEAPFAVDQTDQEGETRLFATGLYCDRLERSGSGLKISDKFMLLDSFAVPSLLATPL